MQLQQNRDDWYLMPESRDIFAWIQSGSIRQDLDILLIALAPTAERRHDIEECRCRFSCEVKRLMMAVDPHDVDWRHQGPDGNASNVCAAVAWRAGS